MILSNWESGVNVSCSTSGCFVSTSKTSTITVNQLPNLNIVTNNNLLCTGQTASLTASGATSYTWNTSSSNTVIAVSPTVTTSYSVIGTDNNGCKNTSAFSQSVSLCTDLQKLQGDLYILNIYPNPASSFLTIQTNEEIATVTIFNITGSVVQFENSNTFSVENLMSGIYFLQISTKNRMVIKRFIKE